MKLTHLHLILAAGLLAGCGSSHDEHDGHDHGPGGHVHEDGEEHGADEGGHVHTAPHGGLLVILGEETAHVELLHDADKGELRAYLLGAHADSPVRVTQESIELSLDGIDKPLVLAAVASALSGETVGDTSEFAVTDPALKGAELKSGKIVKVEMLGMTYEAVAFGGEE